MADLLAGKPGSLRNKEWCKEEAPILPEGNCGALKVISFEKDNPRIADARNIHSSVYDDVLYAQVQSHGQSNFAQLKEALQNDVYGVLILDEPEAALDVDGLLWLRDEIHKSSKQIVVATHSLLLLSITGTAGVSVQEFGTQPNYLSRLKEAHKACLDNTALPIPAPRLTPPQRPAKIQPIKRGRRRCIQYAEGYPS